jgi:DNA (cytosine-5)-methyltransferase 1
VSGGAYYNEIDPFAADWLRELMRRGLIADGEIDTRSIVDVRAKDLTGFTRCHFFAGIGGWDYALQLAGWPDDRPVWTGSCPCPPYSIAAVGHGGAKGFGDHRDLWPVFESLIPERTTLTVFGEQVPGAVGWGWWDRAALDLEAKAYAAAAQILRSDAFEADHERQRVYWVADAGREGRQGHQPIQRLPFAEKAPLTQLGDPALGARRCLDSDFSDLRHSDGLSVVMERHALRCFGNAIDPIVASEFIQAFLQTERQ